MRLCWVLSPFDSFSLSNCAPNWQEMLSESGASYTFALWVAVIWAQLLKYAHRVWTRKYGSALEWLGEPLVKSDVEWDGFNPFLTDQPSYILEATEEAAGERPPTFRAHSTLDQIMRRQPKSPPTSSPDGPKGGGLTMINEGSINERTKSIPL